MKKFIYTCLYVFLLFSCKTDKKHTEASKDTKESESITNNETPDEWISLFDGVTTTGWRAYNGKELPPGWIAKNGELTFDTELGLEEDYTGGKDIIYAAEQFDNFELVWDWKIPTGGNSGLLYHIQEGDWSIPEVAPEYQMLDDLKWEEINNATLEEWQKTGADYAMHIPDPDKKIIKAAGEWNSSKLIFTPEKVEHWLNGQLILSFKPWTEEWETQKSIGKWKDSPKYGTFKKGYIGFQDHDSPLWLKNIKIKKL